MTGRLGKYGHPCQTCLPQAQGTLSVGVCFVSCCLHTEQGLVITYVIGGGSPFKQSCRSRCCARVGPQTYFQAHAVTSLGICHSRSGRGWGCVTNPPGRFASYGDTFSRRYGALQNVLVAAVATDRLPDDLHGSLHPHLHTVPLPLAYSIACSADFPGHPPENSR